MNPTVNLRSDWSLKCHPHAARWFQQHQINDAEQSKELDSFIALCYPGMILFDIGAHFGVFSLAALYYGGKEARAVALDPSPIAVRIVRAHLAINNHSDQRCQVVEAAVGDHEGQINLVAMGPFGGGFYVPSSAKHSVSDFSSTKLTTVDRLIEELGCVPTHLKIDVEGAEAAVLQGAKRTLAASRPPTIWLEMHNKIIRCSGGDPADVAAFLEKLGYALFDLDNNPLLAADVLQHDLIRVMARRMHTTLL